MNARHRLFHAGAAWMACLAFVACDDHQPSANGAGGAPPGSALEASVAQEASTDERTDDDAGGAVCMTPDGAPYESDTC
jgi:hypothetical protein